MQLKKIEMYNFRQFYGNHTLDFATGYKNTTVILGNNNTGKTSIYRALMYGLYGMRRLAQDSSQGDIHLVNFKALEESNLVEARVKITVQTTEGEYIITRNLTGANVQGTIQERDKGVVLDFKDNFGEYHKEYRKKINQITDIINNILDENIKEFFLFDGEKIETLARADRKSRKEVKDGIVRLMEIDKLDEVKAIIRSIYNSEKSAMSRKSANNELDIINKQIETTNFQIEKNKTKTKEVLDNIESSNYELIDIEEEMQSNEENIKLLERKQVVSKDLNHSVDSVNLIKTNMSDHLFDNLAPLVLSDYSISLNEKLKSKLLDQKDLIPMHVLEETLDNKVCLCCNQDINELQVNYINMLQQDYKYSKLTPILDSISRNIENFRKDQDKYNKIIDKNLIDINSHNKKRRTASRELDEIEVKMQDVNKSEEALKALGKRREVLIQTIARDQIKLYQYELALTDLQQKKSELDLKYIKSLKQTEELEYEIKRLEFIESIDKKVNARYDDYIENTRKSLGKRTTDTFKDLIDYKQLSLVNSIEINDKYQMIVKDHEGLDVTQDISQGQQMIVALAFITSLASIASKNTDKLDYPLFMDSPFGRLSQVNRKNLIENLPNLTNQWIPLLTDSDFTEFEDNIFKDTGRVGKVYKINKITDNQSSLVDVTSSKGGF